MISASITAAEMDKAIETVARDLVRTNRVNGTWFINLPMLYPDGSFVTVRVHQAAGGLRVSDAGFAYREAERVDSERAFTRIARAVADRADVAVGKRAIFVVSTVDELERAILDVGETSRSIAEQICRAAWDAEGDTLPTSLRDRLSQIFGEEFLEESARVRGVSTSEWNMSAVIHLPERDVVFQAVRNNGNSINKASTAFRDLSDLTVPPQLVAVVQSKEAIGSRLSLLAPARVLEEGQPDDVYRAAAKAA